MNHFYPLSLVAGPFGININPESFPYITTRFMRTPNNYERMRDRVCQCFAQQSRWPNFVAVDFVGHPGGKERDIVLEINDRRITCP